MLEQGSPTPVPGLVPVCAVGNWAMQAVGEHECMCKAAFVQATIPCLTAAVVPLPPPIRRAGKFGDRCVTACIGS